MFNADNLMSLAFLVLECTKKKARRVNRKLLKDSFLGEITVDLPPYKVGEKWLFFMATRYVVGKVKSVTSCEVVLEDAAWIPETGRMMQSIQSGEFKSVEPYPSGIAVINRLGVNDATPCLFQLPLKQK
jgi:hypothetical protein